MPRRRRHIKSRGLYEITFRATKGLPLPCTLYMQALIQSAIARVQRDNKVILHHYCFMSNHPHMFVTARDANQCQRFYGELQKQLTESIKRLTGIKRLRLWEGRANVSEVPTLEDAIQKIVYIYNNPTAAHLVDTVDEYPGVSTWKKHLFAGNALSARVSSQHSWIRQPMIPALPSRSVNRGQDWELTKEMIRSANQKHSLTIYPNLWMKSFLVSETDEEVRKINARIIQKIRENERANRRLRKRGNRKALGVEQLREQEILKPFTPKKRGRKIFVQSCIREVRLQLIKEARAINELCAEIYQRWKIGDFSIPWPPGTFKPPPPITANSLA